MDKRRQPRRQTNCQAFLVLGIALIALGLTVTATETEGMSIPSIGAGIAFLAIGLGPRAKESVQPPSEPESTDPEAAPEAEAPKPGEQSPGHLTPRDFETTLDTSTRTPTETRRAIRRWIAQAILGWLGYAVILLIAAGRVDWVWGWVFLGILAAFLAAHPLILIPINSDLLAERQQGIRAEGIKGWDRWLAPLAAGVFPMLSWITAGLDLRFGWSAGLPIIAHVAGVIGVVSGLALFLWAMASNAFFAEGVRIQSERGHTVAAGGPYRVVRHPGYAGAILAQAATPLLLGSPWALIPTAGSVIGYILRTALEDKTLLSELPGYARFAETTRHRLVPGLW